MTQRTITFSQGVALYIGAVLGSGILVLPRIHSRHCGTVIHFVLGDLVAA